MRPTIRNVGDAKSSNDLCTYFAGRALTRQRDNFAVRVAIENKYRRPAAGAGAEVAAEEEGPGVDGRNTGIGWKKLLSRNYFIRNCYERNDLRSAANARASIDRS